MSKLLSSNWSTRDTIRLIVSWTFIITCVLAYFLIMVNYFILPMLDGWVLLMPEIISNDDSILNRIVNEEVGESVTKGEVRINNTDWESLSDEQKLVEVDEILDDVVAVQETLFDKLWGIILVVASPMIAIPLGLVFGYKVVIRVTEFIVKVTRLYPKNNIPYVIYFKGRAIRVERDDTLFRPKPDISKKFEEQIDEEIDKCSCIYHDHIHIKCGDECQCRYMKAD